jgi:N-acetylmuramoyl-L-alanine amidase
MSRIVDMVAKLPWHANRTWGARPRSSINRIIVHQALCEGTIEGINRYHTTPDMNNHLSLRGAPHFAYHYGIRLDGAEGEIVQANKLTHVTWHTKGQNKVGVGVMLEGNFMAPGNDLAGLADGPTEKQLASLEWLVGHLEDILKIDPHDVYGHYHFGKAVCPGYKIVDWIENHRRKLPPVAAPGVGAVKTVTELQVALTELGYKPGPADGVFGRGTKTALLAFQADQGLTVDGIAGPQTLHRLLLLLREEG